MFGGHAQTRLLSGATWTRAICGLLVARKGTRKTLTIDKASGR